MQRRLTAVELRHVHGARRDDRAALRARSPRYASGRRGPAAASRLARPQRAPPGLARGPEPEAGALRLTSPVARTSRQAVGLASQVAGLRSKPPGPATGMPAARRSQLSLPSRAKARAKGLGCAIDLVWVRQSNAPTSVCSGVPPGMPQPLTDSSHCAPRPAAL